MSAFRMLGRTYLVITQEASAHAPRKEPQNAHSPQCHHPLRRPRGCSGGAIALSTTAASSAFAAASNAHPNGFAPTEECLNWTGTIQAYPTLSKTAHSVTEVISGTLSNCNFEGTLQTFSGSFFGVLTGSACNKSATLSGNVAITWPQDAGLSPTISPITASGSSNAYSFYGTPSAGAGTGQALEGSYDVVSHTTANGETSQSLVSTGAFGLFVNDG